jgi:hypothetical protein
VPGRAGLPWRRLAERQPGAGGDRRRFAGAGAAGLGAAAAGSRQARRRAGAGLRLRSRRPGRHAAVAAADQLVLVTEPAPSPQSRRVAAALAGLGHAVVVAAGSFPAGAGGARSASPAALGRLLPGVRGVVPLPYPAPAGPPREWAEVPPWWRRPARQLAALLAVDWSALGMTVAGGCATAGPWPPG